MLPYTPLLWMILGVGTLVLEHVGVDICHKCVTLSAYFGCYMDYRLCSECTWFSCKVVNVFVCLLKLCDVHHMKSVGNWSLEKPLLKGYSWKNSKFFDTRQFWKYVILMLFDDTGSNEGVIWHQIRCKYWVESKRENVMWHILRRNYLKEMEVRFEPDLS